MKRIKIGDAEIPLDDYAIGGTAILGIKKSGKTYTAKGIAEQLLDHGVPIIVFDAIGMWRWMKVAGDGPKARGYKVVVAGGESPDLPLTPDSAAEIVRAAIRENISLVIDLYSSTLDKSDWRKIVKTCVSVLLFENVGVRHVFLEECAEYVPQVVYDKATYGAVEKLIRMGGNKSLGITLINPRAQEVNKAVLELCENLILLRQRGRHAIDSLEKSMDHLSPDQAAEIAKSMPRMGTGECWVFASENDEAIRTRSNQINSFHPDRKKPGGVKGRAIEDTSEFISRMQGDLKKFIEEQKANDPKAIKAAHEKEVSELARTIKELQAKVGTVAPDKNQLDAAEKRGYGRGFNEAVDKYDRLTLEIQDRLSGFWIDYIQTMPDRFEHLKDFVSDKRKAIAKVPETTHTFTRPPTGTHATIRDLLKPIEVPSFPAPVETNGELKLSKCARSILSVLAQYQDGRTDSQLAIISGYSVNSSTFSNAMTELRKNYLMNEGPEPRMATADGISKAQFTPLPTGPALREYWMQKVSKCAREILRSASGAFPRAVPREEIAITAGYSIESSTFANALTELRMLELIERGRDIKASDNLF